MKTSVHLRPSELGKTWTLHLWQGGESWDIEGSVNAGLVGFQLPESLDDLRRASFKFRSTDAEGKADWESDAFARKSRVADPGDVWCFSGSSRLVYREPRPPGVQFNPGDLVTISAVTPFRSGWSHG
jgi:hypothetical protein